MKVLLIANYQPDNQPSMARVASIFERELKKLGCEIEVVRPQKFINPGLSAAGFRNKWLGYIDKYILFPPRLQSLIRSADVVHICDHSNAVYAPFVQGKPLVITCHDMLAVRGALGEDTCCQSSPTGKLLQRRILNGLRKADRIACISTYTKRDVERLLGDGCDQKTQLVLLPLDTTLGVIPAAEAESRIAELNPALNAAPFILHVGSSHKRKNRDGVLRVFSELKDRFDGPLVFAGAPLTDELRQLANSYGIADRIIEILRPSDSLLEALYNRAHALLFPSRFEGFGWPLIEAQACGCPVVCSDAGPFGELMQDTALVTPVDDIQAFANNLLMLNDLEIRRQYSNRGLENVKRFLPEIAAKGYLRIYQELLQKSVPEAITVQ